MENELLRTDDYISGLVIKYSDMVLRIAYTYLNNMEEAEDICQNVFLKLVKKQKTFNDSGHEKAFIIRVTVNACKDVLKSPWKTKTEPVDMAALTGTESDAREAQKAVLDGGVLSAVSELPPKYRGVIYLYYFEEYTTPEIARILKEREPTVRSQLKRAREHLKNSLTGGFDDE